MTTTTKTPIEYMNDVFPEARSSGDWYSAKCPAHNDKSASLSFREADDGGIIIKCFAFCEREAIIQAAGLKPSNLYSKNGYKPDWKPRPKLELVDLAYDKMLPWQFLFNNLGIEDGYKWEGMSCIRIPYYTATGELHPKVRIRKELSGNKGSRWDKNTPGEMIPYGLNKLEMAREQGFLIIGEGESDAWTSWFHNIPFLGVPGASLVKCLQGTMIADIPQVYVIQEPDKAGQEFYREIHKQLRATGYAGEMYALQFKKLTGYKDPNELHKALKGKGFRETIIEAMGNAIPSGDEVNEETSEQSQEKQTFIIEGQMRDQVQKALEILKNANDIQPKIFIYLSYISEVAADENGNPIIMQIERAGLRNALNDAADFFKWKIQKDEDPVLVDAHPPKDLADQMLAMAPSRWPLPPLKAIVEAPVLRPDGSILDKPGYDTKTHLYYVPSAGMEKCKIPINPTKDDAIKSMDFIKKIFVDFPFEGKPDLANTIALLFTPFVRYAVTKDIQMALIDATNAGTGKGLISICISIVATGKTTTPMTAKRDDDEWRKAILTELLQSPRIVIIDNIRGTLDSPALELMLTGNGINERILGQSKSAKPKNEATWMATGNNLLIGGDLPRRCYRIRLISPTATPEERDDFEIKDLEQWTGDHRGEIVTAILTVARAWYVAGKPQPKKVPNLGTFTDWVKTVGGMLEFAGVEGFQGNRDDLRSKNNEEAKEWEAFLSSWSDFYGDTWKSASDVAEDLKKANDPYPKPPAELNEPTASVLLEVLPQYLKTALAEKPKSFAVVLPIQLGKRVQTVYGSQAFHIEKDEDSHTKVKVWKVKRGVAVGSTNHTGNEKKSSSHSIINDIVDGSTKHPQPTAPTAKHSFNTDNESAQSSTTGSSTGYQGENKRNEFAGGSKKVMTPNGNGFLTGSVRNTDRGELVGVLINQIEEFHPKSNCYPFDDHGDQMETA